MKIKAIIINYWWVLLITIILFVILAFTLGNLRMKNKISKEVEKLMKEEITDNEGSNTIKEEDLENLPEVVKEWLTVVGIVGQEKIRLLEFSQRGKMKLDKDQEDWISAEAKQYVRIGEPGYLWCVDLPMIPFINTKGRDYFINGDASMQVLIGSLISVVNVKNNKKTNESSLSRFLLELPLYPTAALEDYITWETLDKRSAKAILSYDEMIVAANFYFNQKGMLEKVKAFRYKENDENAKRIPCIGEMQGYETFKGMKIPNKIDITWIIEDQKYTWYKLEIYDYSINKK